MRMIGIRCLVEACTQANIVDYLFTLIDDPQEHNFLYTEYREEVKRIDERIYNTGQPPLSEEYLEQVRAAIRDTLEKTEKGGDCKLHTELLSLCLKTIRPLPERSAEIC